MITELETELNSSALSDNVTLLIAAATIYSHEDNYEAALRVLNQSDALEWLVHGSIFK